MFGMWDVRDVGCLGCGMLGMCDVRDVGCSGCGMFRMWDVWDVGCWGRGIFGMLDVRDVGCLGCRVWDVGCFQGCGMLIYKMPSSIKINLKSLTVLLFYYTYNYPSSFQQFPK